MAITYEWVLNPMLVKPIEGVLTDVVIIVNWRRTAIDETYASDVYGQVAVNPSDPAAFTPFADLTKSQVQGWVVDILTQLVVDQYDRDLAQNIANLKNPPTIVLSAPWEKLEAAK